ncbi:MAG: hypothetical protein P9M11_02225 [Candidatus Tenebribacter burtonii]|jgi:amino acid permease|nr:hypothetical protein [Candidatus Tenebribacter burtonii]
MISKNNFYKFFVARLKVITIIWLIFTIMFLFLGIIHKGRSTDNIAHFVNKSKGSVANVMGVPVGTGFKNFIIDFNEYIDKLNNDNKKQNNISAFRYFLAAITSFISMLLSFDPMSMRMERKLISQK